jgi:beta-lactam-binding protein with PASTA domain
MPNLLNHSMAEAKRALDPLGVRLTERTPAEERYPTRPTEERAKQGQLVIERQSVPAGRDVERGTLIAVVLVRLVAPPATVPKVRVPRLVGKSVEEASAEASRLGLNIRPPSESAIAARPTERRELIDKTIVERQSVESGTPVDKNTFIDVALVHYLAAGVLVPNFRAMAPELSVEVARRASLEVQYSMAPVPTADPGLVGKSLIDGQSVLPGTRVAKGTVVALHVAKYLQRVTKVRVPNFQNLAPENAVRLAVQAGLFVHFPPREQIVQTPTDNPALIGKVLVARQSIPQGQEVNKGTVIENDLVQFHAPGISVPSLVGMSFDDARNRGQSLGLGVSVRQSNPIRTRPARMGERPGSYIENQSIPAGTVVRRGTTVEVSLVRIVIWRRSIPRN